MSAHEWKVLAAFGLLLGGLSLYDPSFAAKVGGIAIVVVLVRNAQKIPSIGDSAQATPAPGRRPTTETARPGSSTLYV